MLSSDLKVFGKLLARTQLFDKVKDIPGDIVECGVFKGAGWMYWLKLLKVFSSGERPIPLGLVRLSISKVRFDTYMSDSLQISEAV